VDSQLGIWRRNGAEVSTVARNLENLRLPIGSQQNGRDPAMRIYAIWGPTAEWGDGRGVVGYATTRREAEAMIREKIEDAREYGPHSWYGSGGTKRNDYNIVPVDPADIPEEMRGWPVDVIVDELNRMLS